MTYLSKVRVRYGRPALAVQLALALLFTLTFLPAFAQPYNSSVTGPIPPSATAMSFGKYADLPIDPASGSMAIGIPLFGISEGSVSHSVSISYHTGGVRPSEIASNIGLGWNLNAGGVISRTVRGIPDDKNDKGYWYTGDNLTFPFDDDQAADAIAGNIDSEMDIFFYNVNGLSGKFVIDKDHLIHMIPQTDIKITHAISTDIGFFNFILTTPDGTAYHFGDINTGTDFRQEIKVNGGESYTETWFLRKIQSYDFKHVIDFHYVDNKYKYRSNPECTVTMWDDGSIQEDENCPTDPIDIEVDGKIISSITSSTGTITFSNMPRFDLETYQSSSGLRINSIEFDDSYRCHKYDLTHDYFYQDDDTGNGAIITALKLEQIQKKSCDNTESEPPYKFDYIGQTFFDDVAGHVQPFPFRLTRAIDHWGYYNGKTGNIAMSNNIPSSSITVDDTPFSYAGPNGNVDRSVDPESTKIGALEKITYPTGGHTILDYENHEYKDFLTNRTELFNTTNCGGAFTCCVLDLEYTTPYYNLSQAMIDEGIFRFDLYHGALIQECPGNLGGFYRMDVLVEIPGVDTFFFFGQAGTDINGIVNQSVSLSTINNLQPGPLFRFKIVTDLAKAFISFDYPPGCSNQLAGGLRVKTITTDDGIPGNNNDIIRTFEYTKTGSTVSSGNILNVPTYAFEVTGHTALFSSQGVLPLTGANGRHVTYSRVKENFDGNGYKEYFTDVSYSYTDHYTTFPPRPGRFIIENGQLEKSNTYAQDNSLLSSTEIAPYNTFQYEQIPGSNISYAMAKYYNGVISFDDYPYHQYTYRTNVFRPATVISSIDGVTTTTAYTYHPTDLVLPPISTSFINSDGKTTKTDVVYTADYSGNSSIKAELDSLHITTIPYRQEQFVDGAMLNGSRTFYHWYDNITGNHIGPFSTNPDIPRPYTVHTYESTYTSGVLQGGWSSTRTFDSYNSQGLLDRYFARGWESSPTTYEYYPNKQLKSTTFKDQTVTYEYHGITTSNPSSAKLKKKINIDATSMLYSFDELGRLKIVQDGCRNNFSFINYFYDQANKVNTVQTTMDYATSVNSDVGSQDIVSKTTTDGLGRSIMSERVSPFAKSMTTTYDNRGRVSQTTDYGGHVTTIAYEASPLNRKLTITPPDFGTTTYDYGHNTTSINDGQFTYAAGELIERKITDGNGHSTITYTDKKGRQILHRNTDGTSNNDTYTLYDDKDRSTSVIPPGATISDTHLHYEYEYNNRDQAVTKTIPESADIEYRYSNRGFIVLQRDNFLQDQNKWYAYEYDDYGREVFSGFFPSGFTPSDVYQDFTIATADRLTQNTYVPNAQNGEGQIKTSLSKILNGGSTWLTDTYTYEPCGRPTNLMSNHHLGGSLGSLMSYDAQDNLVSTLTTPSGISGLSNTINSTRPDVLGRPSRYGFAVNTQFTTTIGENVYNTEEQLITHYIGRSFSYLQKLDYTYLDNNALSSVNTPVAGGSNILNCPTLPTLTSTADLFSYKLYYDQLLPGATVSPQQNGNISGMEWQVRGRAPQAFSYAYDYLDRMTNSYYHESDVDDAYNTTTTYDDRGNILTLSRQGLAPDNTGCYTTHFIDDLSYSYDLGNNSNRLIRVMENASPCIDSFTLHTPDNLPGLHGVKMLLQSDAVIDPGENTIYTSEQEIELLSNFSTPTGTTFEASIANCIAFGNNLPTFEGGFLQSALNEDYIYNDDGDLIRDPNKQITLTYNHLHLTEQIDFDDGRKITFLYDAAGSLLKKQLFEAGSGTPSQTRDYVSGVELLDGQIEFVSHGEGRAYYNGSSFKNQFIISDHLGNARIMFSDLDGNGSISPDTEVLQENNYYPFGMVMSGPWADDANTENEYQYNGIDYVDDFGLNLNMATYRCLDPSIGRWLQVDPRAEVVSSLSPYQHAGNNPISNADPDGDLFFIPQVSFNGGLSLGLEVGFGIPGVLSASVTGGFGSKGGYASIQGSAGGLYAGYGTSGGFAGIGYQYGGFSGGYDFGSGSASLSYGGGLGGRNAGSVGISYGSGGFGWNASLSSSYSHEDFRKSSDIASSSLFASIEELLGNKIDLTQSVDIEQIICEVCTEFNINGPNTDFFDIFENNYFGNQKSDHRRLEGNFKYDNSTYHVNIIDPSNSGYASSHITSVGFRGSLGKIDPKFAKHGGFYATGQGHLSSAHQLITISTPKTHQYIHAYAKLKRLFLNAKGK